VIRRIAVTRLNNDLEASWNEFFGYNTKPFVWNWFHFPVNILFSTFLMEGAPVLVTLPSGPIFLLAHLGAVGPLLAATTFLDRVATDLETVGTVSDDSNLGK